MAVGLCGRGGVEGWRDELGTRYVKGHIPNGLRPPSRSHLHKFSSSPSNIIELQSIGGLIH